MEDFAVIIIDSGARPVSTVMQPGATVADALAAAGVSVGSKAVRLNGATASLNSLLTGDADRITLTTQIKGN